MSFPQLKTISNNLQEIYTAIKIEAGPNFNLTASGERLYCTQASWIGRVVSLEKDTASFLIKKDCNSEQIHSAFRNTEVLFRELQVLVRQKISDAEQSFISWTRGVVGSPDIFDRESKELEVVNLSVRPFLKECVRKNSRLTALFESSFPGFAQNPVTSFHSQDLYEKLGRIARLRLLTTASLGDMPLQIIKKSMLKSPLSKHESKLIRQWLKHIRRSPSCATSRPLFKGLMSMASIWNQFRLPVEMECISFLAATQSRATEYIFQKDPKHMAWRNNLRPGDKLIDYERDAAAYIGEPLNNRHGEEDLNIAFTLRDTPHMVISIAQNRGVLGLRRYGRESNNPDIYGIRPARFYIVSTNGAFALVERLYPITDPEPLIGQMKWQMNEQWTPTPLALKFLMLNENGVLSSVKSHSRKYFDFNSLEQVIYEFVKGDKELYHKMICSSNMDEHEHARYYFKLLYEAVTNKDLKIPLILEHANKMKIRQQEVVDHGEFLFKSMHREVSQLRDAIKAQYLIEKENKFEEAFKDELIRYIKYFGMAGRLWEDFQEMMLKKLEKEFQLKRKP